MLEINVSNVVPGTADPEDTLPDVRFTVATDQIILRDLIVRTVEQQIAELLDNHEQTVRDAQKILDKQYLLQQDVKDQAIRGKIALERPEHSVDPIIDINHEVTRALDAFQQQRYMVFINGKQLLNLDEPIDYKEVLDVKFMRLMPLAGG